MTSAIRFEQVSKRYRRGHAPSFREDTLRGVRAILGRSRPAPVVEALKNVSFDVERGSSFAIMGVNGSGKTTALRLMSHVTYPTSGRVSVAGRVGALIEVGTGLHPELTGRENVSLYGRILGLGARAISERFDRIADFAGVGAAIDQPIKQYSSGMQLRLGFSLAAHLEPDVLLVDEAISVGDALFQRRCIQRMLELHDAGITLVFVSHVASVVGTLCTEGILLRAGEIVKQGPVNRIVEAYLAETAGIADEGADGDTAVAVRSWMYSHVPREGVVGGALTISLALRTLRPLRDPRIGIAIGTMGGAGLLLGCYMQTDGFTIGPVDGDIAVECKIVDLPLDAGEFDVWIAGTDGETDRVLLPRTFLGYVSIGRNAAASERSPFAGTPAQPIIHVDYEWRVRYPSPPGTELSNPNQALM